MKNKNLIKRLTSILLVLLLIFGDVCSALGPVTANAEGVDIPIKIIDYTDPANHPANNDMFASTVPGENTTANTAPLKPNDGSSVSANSSLGANGTGGTGSVSATPGSGTTGGTAGSNITIVNPDGSVSIFPSFGGDTDSGELTVTDLIAGSRYAVVNEKPMSYTIGISGGTAPYHVHFAVRLNGDICFEQREDLPEAGQTGFEWTPVLYGEHDVAVTVKDAMGKTVSKGRSIPVAVWETEDFDQAVSGVELTGDWATDVVAIASSQIGRGENKRNFRIDENGTSYYSMYSHWCYNDPFAPWESAFVLFCIDKAGVPEKSFPRSSNVSEWISTLQLWGLFNDADSQPVAGDLAFFANGSVGIVAGVQDGVVYIIDGDRDDCDKVAQYSHAQGDAAIIGYGRLGTVQTNPSTYVAPAKPLTDLRFTSSAQTGEVGEIVTFTAVLPEGVEPSRYLWQWQMSPDGVNWIDVEGARDYTWTVQTTAAHYLNLIRVVAEPAPQANVYARSFMNSLATAAVEAGTGDDGNSVAAAPMLLSARASTDSVYWNPYGSPTFSEDGVMIVAPGIDSASGTSFTAPVLSLSKAVDLATADGKTIVCMNLYNSYENDDSLTKATQQLTIVGYDGGGDPSAAHEGQYFSSKSGTLSMANIYVEETESVLELDGGKATMGEKVHMPGSIFLNSPTPNLLPLTINAPNEANAGVYIVSFNPDFVGTVGIASGDHTTGAGYIQLDQSLLDRGWMLKLENGNTYAYIPPNYEAIYLDGLYGLDSNDGNSPENPVRTLKRAQELLATLKDKNVDTIYVTGTVTIDGSTVSINTGDSHLFELASTGIESAKIIRHSRCAGAMFRIVGGEPAFSLTIDNSESGSPVFEVSGGTLTLDRAITINNATGTVISMSGGNLNISGGDKNITGAATIVGGNAGEVSITDTALSASGSVVDLLTAKSFTTTGTAYTGSANNTLAVSGTAKISGGTTIQAAGTESSLGSVRSYSGSLEVDGVNLNRVGAASSVTLKNCAISTIENTGSSTLLSAVTGVTTLTAAGSLTIENGSVVANATSTGSTVTVTDSNVTGTLSAAGTATVTGTLSAADGSSTANINTLTAQGNTTVTGAQVTNLTSHGTTNSVTDSTVGTLSLDGTSTINNSAVTVEAFTAVSTIDNGEKNIAKLTASGNTTLTSGSVSMLICNGGDVNANGGSIAQLTLNGASSALVTAGEASTPDVSLVGNNALIKLSGKPVDEHIQLTITNEYNGRVVVQGSSYDASQHINVDDVTSSVFQRAAGSSDSFWLDTKDNDIILTAPTGVYVDTLKGKNLDGIDNSIGHSANNPVKTFAEAAQLLADNPSLPRIIYVIGQATIADGDTLNPSGTRVTVMPYDSSANTLITVPSGVSFVPSNVDFDGAGLASGSTLINVQGTFSTSSAQLKNANTLVNMASGSSVTLTNSTLTPNTNGTGIVMAGGTLNASGSIKVSGSGKGLDMANGTATISSRIDLASSSGLGINVTGGKLNFNGSVYGNNAITAKNAVIDSTGSTYSSSGSTSSSSYGKVTIENSTLNVKGGTITSLSQTSGTTNISSGHVEYMTMDNGVLNVTGGSLDYLTHKKGSTRISGGTVYSSTVTAGDTTVSGTGRISSSITLNGSSLAGATLEVLGGGVGTINHNGGTVTVTGGTVSTAKVNNSDSRSRIFANGGSISTAYMYGTDSILHTNGTCNLGTVYLGDSDGARKGANAYIALSGPVTKSGKINIIVGDVNYYENYSVVKPEAPDTDAADQLAKFSIDSMKKRFNLAAGTGDKSTHIVLAFDGVFIDTQYGSDSNDGLTYSTAVQSFYQAGKVMAERLRKDPTLVPVIYVVNSGSPYTPATAIVSGNDTLDMTNVTSNNGKVYVTSFNSSCDLLVSVPSGTSLTITNADLDGVGNNAGLQTSSVLNVAGTFSISNGDVKNGRGTVMTVSGTATLSNAKVHPYEDNRSTSTAVKLNDGTLTLNSSSAISYGKYGVDMDGGTLELTSGSVKYANTDGIYNKGGTVTIESGSSVSSNYGSGINMTSGTLTLNGGSISSNYLVGVKMSGGKFTMPSGTISSNGSSSRSGSLGGVYMTGSDFDMTGGAISSNRSNSTGGGVYVGPDADFSFTGGSVSSNSASGNGGGVCVNGGTFTMSGAASVSGNSSSANGGGIYAGAGSTISINGTASSKLNITNNTASNGGGMYYNCGLTDPTYVNLTGNTANTNGGGIYINGSTTGHTHTLSTFAITGNTAKGSGGGLYNNCLATVNISGTDLSRNTATNNGGAVYSARGEITGNSNTKLNNSSASNGGALYVAGGSVSLHGADLSSSHATNSKTGGNGGAVYVAGGTVDLSGANLSNSYVNYTTSTSGGTTSYNGGNGGAVYVSGGTVTLDNANMSSGRDAYRGGAVYVNSGTVSLNSANLNSGKAVYGGGIYVNNGEVSLDSADLHSSSATYGGAVYVKGGEVDLDSADLHSSSATYGGGIYVEDGTVNLTGTNLNSTTAATQGAAIYAEAGTVNYAGATTASAKSGTNSYNTADEFGTIYTDFDAKFNHLSGTVTGNVQARGLYTVTLTSASGTAITGGIELLQGNHPLTISDDSASGYTGTFDVTVGMGFMENVIVKGTKDYPARFTSNSGNFNVIANISPCTERGNDIVGPMATDVFWDPSLAYPNTTKDENNGASYDSAVLTFERAKKLLAQRGPNARIVMCSTCFYTTSGGVMAPGGTGSVLPELPKGVDNTDTYYFNGSIKGNNPEEDFHNTEWTARIIRNTGFTGFMFAAVFNESPAGNIFEFENIVISGEYYSGGGISTRALIGANDSVLLTNVELCNNHTSSQGAAIYIEPVRSMSIGISNCNIHDNSAHAGAALHAYTAYSSYINTDAEISNTAFTNNIVTGNGGAIYSSINITIADEDGEKTNFTNNTASIVGGAIYSNGSTIVNGASFSGNTAFDGGAIYSSGSLTVTGASFNNNNAENYGGAICALNRLSVNSNGDTMSSFVGNTSAINGAAICFGLSDGPLEEEIPIPFVTRGASTSSYFCAIDGARFTSNICGTLEAPAGEIIHITGAQTIDYSMEPHITNSVIGNVSASAYPVSAEEAISNGGNSAMYAVYSPNELTIRQTNIDGNYAQNSAVASVNIYYTGGSVDFNSHDGVIPSGAIDFDSASVSGNGKNGLKLDNTSTIYAFEITGCVFDNNAEYGAYIPWLNIAGNKQPTIGADNAEKTSFNGNGISGLYIDADTYINSDYPLTIRNAEFVGNGNNNIEGHGLHLVDRGANDSYGTGKVKLINTIVSNNGSSATTKGGGVYVDEGVNLLLDSTVTISGNEAEYGGAIYWEDHSVSNNVAYEQGYGATLSGNKARLGGAIYADKDVTLGGFNIVDNEAELGGGIYVDDGALVKIQKDSKDINTVLSGNEAELGGAIYLAASDTSELDVNAAVIRGNSSTSDTMSYASNGLSSGIYNGGAKLHMAGSNVDISDNIYLNNRNYPISLTASMSRGVIYNIALNMMGDSHDTSLFNYGDVVVGPSDGYKNAAQWLRYTEEVIPGNVFAKGRSVSGGSVDSVVLKRCLFVDGVNGKNGDEDSSHDGETPSKAFRTMEYALDHINEDNYVIYICGPVYPASESSTWEHSKFPIDIRRYTGFAIGGESSYDSYDGDLVVVPAGYTLTIGQNINSIAGWHDPSDPATPHGSIFNVNGGGTLNFTGITTLEGNSSSAQGGAIHIGHDADNANVNVSGTLSISDISGVNGGAICVDEGSQLNVVAGGTLNVSGSSAVNGGAIYNSGTVNNSGTISIHNSSASSNGDAIYNVGTLMLNNGSTLDTVNEVYITNNAFITLQSSNVTLKGTSYSYDQWGQEQAGAPSNVIPVSIGDPRDGRTYARYLEGTYSLEDANVVKERTRYTLPNSITSSFLLKSSVEAEGSALDLILSQSNVVYVDPSYTGGEVSGKLMGGSPDYPFTNLYDAYKKLSEGELKGGLIYIVTPITITGNTTVGLNGYTDSSSGKSVDLGTAGVNIRRYSKPTGYDDAADVQRDFTKETNLKELFIVQSGTLTLDGVTIDGHEFEINTSGPETKFTIAPAVTAVKPAVTVSGGMLKMINGAQLSGNNSSTEPSAVHNGAELRLEGSAPVGIDGTVFLDGTHGDLTGDKYIEVITSTADDPATEEVDNDIYVSPLRSVNVLIDDPEDGRPIAKYNGTPGEGELAKYSLPANIMEGYKLAVDGNYIVLRVNNTVYVDGVDGDDRNNGTPDEPIATLREAYLRLQATGGTIYIVDTVSVSGSASLTLSGTRYSGGSEDVVTIDSGSVSIKRYSHPSASTNENPIEGYKAPGNLNALINITGGGSLRLSNIVVDGHSADFTGSQTTTAPAVSAIDAMIIVGTSGVLELGDGAVLKNNNNAQDYGSGGAIRIGGGTVNMTSGSRIEANSAAYGAGIFNAGTLTMAGNVNFGSDQWIYANFINKDNYPYIGVLAQLTGSVIPVQLRDEAVTHGIVIARYNSSLTPDAERFQLTQDNNTRMNTYSLAKTTKDKDVLLLAGYNVTYSLEGLKKGDPAPDRAAREENFTAFIAQGTSGLPDNITVQVQYVDDNGVSQTKTLTQGTDFSYNPSTGEINIPAANVIGHITITAVGIEFNSITYDLSTGITPAANNPVGRRGSDSFTANFSLTEGYVEPTVTVTVNGETVDATKYSYIDGVFTLLPGGAEGDVHVKLETTLIDYALIIDFENAHVDALTGSNGEIITVDGELRVQHGTTITGTVVVDNAAASTLPESIEVYINGYLVDEDKYSYNKTTGDFEIPGTLVSADVEIRGAAPTYTYTITYTLSPENILVPITDAPVSVPYGQAVSTGIESSTDNVLLPDSITVKVGETTLTDGYTYSKDNGLITINGDKVSGNIEIIANGINVYTVTTNFTGVVATSVVPTTVVQGNGISFTVTGDTGYKLPDSITVTIGDNTYTGDIYDKATGQVSIPADAVTGNVVITITGVPVYNVSYNLTNLVVEAPIPVTVDQGDALEFTLMADPNKGGTINLPTTVTVTGAENETYDVTDGKVTIPADDIKGHLKVVAVGTQTFTVTAQPVNVTGLTGATLNGNGTCATAAYTATAVEAADGYVLPDSISVSYTDTGIAVTGFTWSVNNGVGTLTVPAASITAHITVSITAIKEHTVTFAAAPDGSVILPEVNPVMVVDGAALPSQTVTAQRGYKLTGILVNGVENSSYDYDPTVTNDEALTATISAEAGVVTGDVTITVKAVKRSYSITETVINADVPGAYDASETNETDTAGTTITDGAAFTATIKADEHYELPSSITVSINGGTPVTINGDGEPGASGITYDSTTGVLNIPENVITGPVVIDGSAVPKTYNIKYDLGALLVTGDPAPTSVTYNTSVTADINVNTDTTVKGTVTLPTSVSIAYTGTETAFDKFTYDSSSGTISFADGDIDGNITITARGVQSFSVTTNFNNEATATTAFPPSVSASEGTATVSVTGTVKANDGYALPDSISVTVTGTDTAVAHSYDSTTGTITVDASVIHDNITITVDPLKLIHVTYSHVVPQDANYVPGSSGSSTPATVTEGTGLTAVFTLATGYEYVGDGAVVTGLASGAEYGFNKETHTLTVDKQYITGSLESITVTVTTKLKDYEVSYDGTLTQPDEAYEDKEATHGQDFTTVIEPAADPDGKTEDVRLPDSITVQVEKPDGTVDTLDPKDKDGNGDYTYDPETGKITIDGDKVVGPITITANGVRQYDVTYVMGTLLASIEAQLVDEKAATTEVTIAAATGMTNVDLPKTVTVTMANGTGTTTTLTAGTDYSYNSTTGAFSIKADVITGDVTVTAEGHQWYTVTYSSDTGNVTLPENITADTADRLYSGEAYIESFTADFGYEITNVTVTMGGTDIKSEAYTAVPCTVQGLTDDILGGTISIEAVTGDVVITVSTAKRVYDVSYNDANDKAEASSEQDADAKKDGIQVEHEQGSGEAPDVTIVIEPDEGYDPPASPVIIVIDPETGDESEPLTPKDENGEGDYSYEIDENGNGVIVLDPDVITGPIIISGDATIKTYTVSGTLTNITSDKTGNTATVDHGGDVTFTLTAATGYNLPQTVSIVGVTYTYTRTDDNNAMLTFSSVTSDIEFSLAAQPETYTVTANVGTLLDYSGATGEGAAIYGQAYTAKLSEETDAKGNVSLPATVSYTVTGGAAGSETPYTATVDATNGQFTIPAEHVTGNISITAAGVQTFTVTAVYSNDLSLAEGYEKVKTLASENELNAAADYTLKVQANTGHALPDFITVQVGPNGTEQQITASSSTETNVIRYNKESGEILIPKADITDNVTVTISGVELHNVSYIPNANMNLPGESTVEDGKSYNGEFTAKEGYKITAVKVVMGETELENVYTPGNATGDVLSGKVNIEKVTGDVTITVTTERRQYTLTNAVNNSDIKDDDDNKITINHGLSSDGNVTITLVPEDGWDLPPVDGEGKLTITVVDPDDKSETSLNYDTDYSYDPDTGVITITKPELLDGDVTITGTAKLKVYNVSANLTNLTAAFAGVTSVTVESVTTHTVEHKKPAGNAEAVIVTLDDSITGYDLPDTVTVSIDGAEGSPFTIVSGQTYDTGISYDSATGIVTIPANVITGDIVVTAIGVAETYTVDYTYTPTGAQHTGSATDTTVTYPAGYSGTIKAATGYRIDAVKVLMGADSTDMTDDTYAAAEAVYNGDVIEGTVSFDSGEMTDDVTVTVSLSKRVYTVTEEEDHYEIDSEQDKDDETDVIEVEHQQGSGEDEDDVTITIEPDEGYLPPDEITITVIDPDTGKEKGPLDDDDYTYNPEDGTITITNPEAITGPIEISGDAVPLYDVTFKESYNNAAAANLGTTVEALTTNPVIVRDQDTMSDVAFEAKPGYQIVSVTMDGNELSTEKNEDYTYNEVVSKVVGDITGGSLSISSVTADTLIVINTAKRVYDVTNSGDNTTIGSDDDKDDDEEGIQLEHGDGDEEGTEDDVVITVTPETGYELPEEITVIIRDPDGNTENDRTLTEDEDYSYDPDSGEIIIHVPITGPVEIDADATIKTFAITENISNAAAEDKTDSEKPVDIPTSGDSHKVEYGQEVKVQVYPDYGYDYPETITVTIDGLTLPETDNSDPDNPKPNYTYYPKNGELIINPNVITGPVVISGEAKHKVYNVKYVLAETGEDANLKVDEEYEDKKPVHDEAFTTVILPISDSILLPDEIEITMNYVDEEGEAQQVTLRPEATAEGAAQYTYEIVEVEGKKQGKINIPANVIKGDIVINAIGIDTFDITLAKLTLTAVDDEKRLDPKTQWKTEVRDLLKFEDAEGNKIITMERLRGKTFTITSVTPSTGLSLDEKDDVLAKQFTAGSDYANSTFGLTLKLNDGTEINVAKNASISFAADAAKADLSFTLYNANAITLPGGAGTVTVTLTSNAGDVINLAVNINRVTSQINVTVPLVMVLKTNIDGGSATVADSSYYLDNNSSMRLALTDVDLEPSTREGHTGVMTPVTDETTEAQLLNMRDSFKVYFKAWTGTELAADDAMTGANAGADTYNPIEKVATSPLTFVTNANEAYGIHMATVTYTVSIPEADAATDSTTGSGK